mmetsp:Transcript_14586/g.1320  ORF Transcript_14586/g.1320 Transcript_14586/m.1320 type:complete len:85 (-) Transcript_14586:280-534(-)
MLLFNRKEMNKIIKHKKKNKFLLKKITENNKLILVPLNQKKKPKKLSKILELGYLLWKINYYLYIKMNKKNKIVKIKTKILILL